MVNINYRKQRLSLSSDNSIYVLNGAFLIILFILVIYPIVYILSASFSSGRDVVSGRVFLLPVNPSLEGYIEVFNYNKIFTGYLNTIIYTVAGTILGIIMTFLCAFPLSRKNLYGRKLLAIFFIIPMYFSGGLVPTYLLINKLGIYNTRAAVVIPLMLSIYNILIARTFFATNIPEELYESSLIDGSKDFHFFFYIVLPLSKTITAVMALFYGIRYWNNFFQAFIYLNRDELYPLQIVLREILFMTQLKSNIADLGGTTSNEEVERVANMYELIKYCSIVVASLPIVCFYPFIQRYFVKGIMMGSIKG